MCSSFVVQGFIDHEFSFNTFNRFFPFYLILFSCLCFCVSNFFVLFIVYLLQMTSYSPSKSLVSLKCCRCEGRDIIQFTIFIYFAFHFITGILLFSLMWRKSKYGKPSRISSPTIKWRQVFGLTVLRITYKMIDSISSWLTCGLVVLCTKIIKPSQKSQFK